MNTHHYIRTYSSISVLFIFLLLCSCGSRTEHLIQDTAIRQQTEKDFSAKRIYLSASLPFFADTLSTPGELFTKACGLSEGDRLNSMETEALVFLYAYMPLNDMSMHTPRFFLDQVRASFEVQKTFSWGKQVPDLIFRHFVLPPRVNNENLDSCRTVFMKELAPRLQGMTMQQAALEVNHWCHEKVIYRPTDGRTSGPLAVVARAYGRCGEESVFTVAALRSVGIPARQVYTPRWAHTDDNHAWVEVWADGQWYYLGACEPEPELNRAWFSTVAQQAMQVHTWVFGKYSGPEEILREEAGYTEINVLPVYAASRLAQVTLTDEQGLPVEGATIEFGLYNYAEFYPIAKQVSDKDGKASLTTGLGTLVIQAVKDDLRAIAPFPVYEKDTLLLVLRPFVNEKVEHYHLKPPAEGKLLKLSEADAQRHAARLEQEDSIRMAYIATFPFSNQEKAANLAEELKLGKEAIPLLQQTFCNGSQVESFLRKTSPGQRKRALKLLEILPEKDLQEVSEAILTDHLKGVESLSGKYKDTPLYEQYVLQPRVDNELIIAWRQELWKMFGNKSGEEMETLDFVRECLSGIEETDNNFIRCYTQSPLATLQTWKANLRSKNVLGVALLRTLGIPSRIDPVTGRFEAFVKGAWAPVWQPSSSGADVEKRVKLNLRYTPQNGLNVPRYETHYTLGRWENGTFRTLGLSSEEADLSRNPRTGKVETTVEVLPGNYRIITGRRLSDGSVLARTEYFVLEPGSDKSMELLFEQVDQQVAVIGNMNPEARYMPAEGNLPISILQTTGRGFFVLLLVDTDKEPSRHLLEDLGKYAGELETLGLPIVCILKDSLSMQRFRKPDGIPSGLHLGYEMDGNVSKELAEMLERPDLPVNRPLVMVADTFGRVFYYSLGYNIGSVEALTSVVRRMKS